VAPKAGNFGGVCLWDSKESLHQFQQSEFAKSIPQDYKVLELPQG
jgi:hypothetical protein